MASAHWEHFEHGADIGVRGIGPTLDEAFEQAALGLTAAITNPEDVRTDAAVEIHCQNPDPELLLADWLNELVYEMATRGMLFGRFEVRMEADRLEGRAWGESVDVKRHEPTVEVKGATYTALRVYQDADGMWIAQCIVDV